MNYITVSLLLIGLLPSRSLHAQNQTRKMSDLAYVIEDTTDRRQVLAAMDQFHANTGATLSFLALFEDDIYTNSAEQNEDQWLRQQDYGISISIKVADRNKTFSRCDIRISPVLTEWLPTHERQRIQHDIMEYYFDGDLITSNAYTMGLVGGIRAMQEVIIKNKNRSDPLSITERVREVLLVMQEESSDAEDSLSEVVSMRSEVLEKVIEKGYFYPPRIKGPNDEFIGDGMSQYAALIVRTAAEKKQMEPIMLALDSVRNTLYRTDYALQRNRAVATWIEEVLPPEPLAALSEKVDQAINEEDSARLTAAIRTTLEQMMTIDLAETK